MTDAIRKWNQVELPFSENAVVLAVEQLYFGYYGLSLLDFVCMVSIILIIDGWIEKKWERVE